jgi:hypothetical protein
MDDPGAIDDWNPEPADYESGVTVQVRRPGGV